MDYLIDAVLFLLLFLLAFLAFAPNILRRRY